jgi:solute carrier family 19 (thiamine transporter), member 2/3
MWSYTDSPKEDQNSPSVPSVRSATLSGDTISRSTASMEKPRFSWNRARQLLWEHFIQAYSNKTVLIWSIFWSLAMGGFLQIQSYVQLLWLDIDSGKDSYNGAVEATLTLFGAISCLVAGFIPSEKFEKFDLWIMTACSLVEGTMIIVSSITEEIWIAYAMYISFGIIYMFMITLASATVAKNLEEDSFALIFGINTLFALVVQTILTVVVISETGLGLSKRGQFLVFGGYFVALAVIFLIGSFVKLFLNRRK